VGELLCLMEMKDIVTCNRVCKGFRELTTPTYLHAVNYAVLFKDQGLVFNQHAESMLTKA